MESSNESWMAAALEWLAAPRHQPLPPRLSEAIASASGLEIEQLIELLSRSLDALPLGSDWLAEGEEQEEQGSEGPTDPSHSMQQAMSRQTLARLRAILQMAAARTLRLRLENEGAGELEPAIDPDVVADLAAVLSDKNALATAHCLQILAAQGDAQSLAAMCELIKRQTLEDEQSVAVALSPLFQWPPRKLASVFELIGEDIWKWQLLGPMLDLAGHSLRRGKLKQHPLAGQPERLRELLGGTVQRLARLEEDPQRFGDDVPSIQRVLSNAISLAVSLCDTLGLIGDQAAEGKLNQAMSLSHRRVQTEAAGALARLGQEEGKRRLIQLAQDPAARLRALAYTDELGIDDPSLAELRSPASMAEAEVVSWLADRERFGVPPADLELVDERTQYWPSYEDPQNCFLFRFTYHFARGDLSNIVIAGPLVYAFQADLRPLEVEDIYSVFAGWQAEHEDIYEVAAVDFNSAQQAEADRLIRELRAQGIDDLHPLALTFFFGERAVLAVGTRAGQSVCVVSDNLESIVQPIDNRPMSLTPDLVLALYRGRKLLRTFNT